MIRWGIIGCGNVTEVKSGPGFQKAQGSSLVAVMRRNGELAEDYARRHNVPRWYTSADELIGDSEVDAVYVGTPPGTHLEYALRVCAAGKPAYIEKPMARNHAECQRMVEAFAAKQTPLFIAYYRRGLARFIKVKELIQTGRIGDVTSFCYRYAAPLSPSLSSSSLPRERETNMQTLPWRLIAEHAGGGLFMDLGSHTLDILDFILGPLEAASGIAANQASPYDVEDTVALCCRTQAGALGSLVWNFAAGVSEDVIEINGTDGCVSLSTFGAEPVRLETENGAESFDGSLPEHVQQPLIQTIVDELLGSGSTAPSTGVSAARTARVMDLALESYYGSRDDEFWNRPQTWPGLRKIG